MISCILIYIYHSKIAKHNECCKWKLTNGSVVKCMESRFIHTYFSFGYSFKAKDVQQLQQSTPESPGLF